MPDDNVAQAPPDEDAMNWIAAIAQIWARDWSDPREDIYTLEDGLPIDK